VSPIVEEISSIYEEVSCSKSKSTKEGQNDEEVSSKNEKGKTRREAQ
jgi:hypothetical protein